jgi:CDP-glucose 4,6-dehydratase
MVQHLGKLGNLNFEAIYKDKKIFITGHTGFKGSWLLVWLHSLGANIKGYALAPENEYDLFNAIKGNELCDSIIADIRNQEKLKHAILDFQPDYIFHLAAQPLVIESYKNPVYTHEVNIIGTANVLEALNALNKPCIAVMITTDKVYHNYETGQAYKEEDRLGGYDPYSASKGAAEIVIDSYRKSFFNPAKYIEHQKSVSVARAGNVIGGGDWAKNRIIPDIVRALSASQAIQVRNPNAVRPWQHVLEPLSGYLTLAAKQTEDPIQFADAFNFGPELTDNLTVEEIVQEAIKVWGEGNFTVPELSNVVHEAMLLQLDISKAKEKLSWYPKFTATQAIDKTLGWYKSFTQRQANAFTLINNDIQAFNDA